MNSTYATQAHCLTQHIQRQAVRYFSSLAGESVVVELIRSHSRRYSRGYEFSVIGGEQRCGIFVKVPLASRAQKERFAEESSHLADRPRLVPLLPAKVEARHERAALQRMGDHFAEHGDSSIGVPRLLDACLDDSIIVEAIQLPTLEYRLMSSDQQSGQSPLPVTFENTGRWLRAFHNMTPHAASEARLASRREVVEQFAMHAEYLQQSGVTDKIVDRLAGQFLQRCEEVVPKEFDLVIGHGDFGLHNVFAGDDGLVIGFDTLAYWRTAPLEDMAYFLLLLENPPPLFRRRSPGRQSISTSQLREAFLRGYFQDRPIPAAQLRLYEILVAMDKWVSVIHTCRRAKGITRALKRCRLMVQQRAIVTRLRELLDELSSHEPDDQAPTATTFEPVA